ncbi:MAG: hypothetical protein LBC83_05750 [Oscillospiraceae bacterium]|jgi:hypothetical protein|nr:hypothetical protein [Oscillospiraceae bacterium]
MKRVVGVILLLSVFCAGFAGCKQAEQEIVLRSAWGGGSLVLRIPGAKPEATEDAAQTLFRSKLSTDELAEVIVAQLPADVKLERPGGSILLLQVIDGRTDYYYLCPAEELESEVITNEVGKPDVVTEKPHRRGVQYQFSCLQTSFASPTGAVSILFPRHFLRRFSDRLALEPLPLDTPMPISEVSYRALFGFYQAFGRYQVIMVDGAAVISGYQNLPEGVEEYQLPPLGERLYIKLEGLSQSYTVQISMRPDAVKGS